MFMLMWLLGKCLHCLYEEHLSNYPETKTTPSKYTNRRVCVCVGGGIINLKGLRERTISQMNS